MIYQISGNIHEMKEDYVILETGGIGYQVFVPDTTQKKLDTSQQTTLYTYRHIREDTQQLFGFSTPEDKLFSKPNKERTSTVRLGSASF